MTQEEAIEKIWKNKSINSLSKVESQAIVEQIYKDMESYLKTQAEDQRRDFRARCVFKEVLEHIGGTD